MRKAARCLVLLAHHCALGIAQQPQQSLQAEYGLYPFIRVCIKIVNLFLFIDSSLYKQGTASPSTKIVAIFSKQHLQS